MIIDAGLSHMFWAEALMTANYIQNRLPTKGASLTPYEHWNKAKPGILHFQIFGSKCYVHVPTEKRRKWDDTDMQMLFVGYDEQSKAYRCYDPVTRKVVVIRDVRFVKLNGNSMFKHNFGDQSHMSQSSEISFDSHSNNNNNNSVKFAHR